MSVHESRILQVTLFGALQNNLAFLDFSLLPDVMTIADEVDAQLTQSIDSYMKAMRKSATAWLTTTLTGSAWFTHQPADSCREASMAKE
jgi:hypothetical protein